MAQAADISAEQNQTEDRAEGIGDWKDAIREAKEATKTLIAEGDAGAERHYREQSMGKTTAAAGFAVAYAFLRLCNLGSAVAHIAMEENAVKDMEQALAAEAAPAAQA